MIKDTNKSAHEIGFDVGTLVKGGGCAFPFVIELDDNKSMAYSHGMTLRDYFAAKALNGMFANPDDSHENYDLSYDNYVKEIARCAYKMADAMLEARNK